MHLCQLCLPLLLFTTPITSAPLTLVQATSIVEIQQVTNLYALALDQHQLGFLPQVFTQDVVVDFNVPGRGAIRGLQALSEQIRGTLFPRDSCLTTVFPFLVRIEFFEIHFFRVLQVLCFRLGGAVWFMDLKCLPGSGKWLMFWHECVADMYGLTSTHRLSNGYVWFHDENAAHAATYCLATFFRDGVQIFQNSGR